MLTRTAQVALNTLTNFLRFGVLFIVFFFLTPFIIHAIGKEEFGLWSLIFSILGIFGLLDLGFGTGVVKWVSEAKASHSIKWRNEILSTVMLVYLILAFVGIIIIAAMSIKFNSIFSIPESQHEKAIVLFWIIAFRSIILNLPLSVFRGVLFGEQKIYILNFVQSAFSIIYAVIVWAFLTSGYGIITLAWINLCVMIAEHLTYIVFAYKNCDKLKFSFSLANIHLFREAASFSAYSFIVQISALVLLRTDTILVKFFLPLSAVAVYVIALKIAEYAHLVIKQFTNVLMPVVAEFKERQDKEKLRFILVNAAKFALAPAVIILVIIVVHAKQAIVFWLGPEFEQSAPVLIILMAAMTLAVPQLTAANVLTMTGYHKFFARSSIISMIINITVSVILIHYLGLTGVAIGTLVAVVFVDVYIVVKKAYSLYEVKYSAIFTRIFFPALLPGILQFAVTLGFKLLLPPTGLLALLLETIPGIFCYCILFWIIAIEDSEKKLIKEKIIKFRK